MFCNMSMIQLFWVIHTQVLGSTQKVLTEKFSTFAHVNDGFNQCYFKLDFLDQNDHNPELVIMIIDYFQFGVFSDARNYAYQEKFHTDYLSDYPDKNYVLLNFWSRLNPLKLNELQFGTKTITETNGFQIKTGQRHTGDSKLRKMEWNKVQMDYFNKIVEFCSKKKIKIYLFMQPIQLKEISQYTSDELLRFETHVKNSLRGVDNANFYNYSKRNIPSEYYSDNTHLNQKGAMIFSKMIDSTISNEYE